MFKVIEIFNSIDGEGRRAGELATFIRLSGCNLSCSWCDTSYSQDGKCGEMMTLNQIMDVVDSFHCYNVTLTGGEPLIHNNVDELIIALLDGGYDVNVETNGSIDPVRYITDEKFNNRNGSLWFTIDYKSFSSGMNSRMNVDYFKSLRCHDVIKFVVGSREELIQATKVIDDLPGSYYVEERLPGSCWEAVPQVYLSPVFGMIEPVEIVDFMKEMKFNSNVKVQVQLHKIIWNPNERGV